MADTGTTVRRLLGRLDAPLLVTAAVVLIGYVAALAVLRILLDDTEVAGTLAALVIGAGPRIQRELEDVVPRTPDPVVSFAGYRLRWWLLLLAGAAAVWLAECLRVVLSLAGGPVTAVSQSLDAALTILPVAAAIGVGVLAGARADRWPIMVVALAIVGGHLLADFTRPGVVNVVRSGEPGLVLCPPTDAPADATPPADGAPAVPPPVGGADEDVGPVADPCAGAPPDPVPALLGTGFLGELLAGGLPLLALAGMASLWWGARMRLAFYFGRVARSLTEADRTALVEMASAEANRRRDGGR